MQKFKNLSMILSGVVMGGLLLSGGLVYAGDSNNTTQDSSTKPAFTDRGMEGRGGMRGGHRGGFGFGGGALLSQDTLDKLVKAEVITQDKATEIKTYIDKQDAARKAEMEKIQNMTADERQAYFEEKAAERKSTTPTERPGMLADLVTNKILTQEQADAIQSKLAELAQQEQQQKLADSLKTLVDKGTITQAQADQITAKFQAMQKEQQDLREKLKAMTEEERKAYLEENPVNPMDPLSAIVSAGVITEDQASVIKELTPFGGGHRGGKFNSDQAKTDTTTAETQS